MTDNYCESDSHFVGRVLQDQVLSNLIKSQFGPALSSSSASASASSFQALSPLAVPQPDINYPDTRLIFLGTSGKFFSLLSIIGHCAFQGQPQVVFEEKPVCCSNSGIKVLDTFVHLKWLEYHFIYLFERRLYVCGLWWRQLSTIVPLLRKTASKRVHQKAEMRLCFT
jgi:hypothetical protein